MDSITIDNLDDSLVAGLSKQAQQHGRSIEEEALLILQREVAPKEPSAQTTQQLGLAIRDLFADVGGLKMEFEGEFSCRWIADTPEARERLEELVSACKRGQGENKPKSGYTVEDILQMIKEGRRY